MSNVIICHSNKSSERKNKLADKLMNSYKKLNCYIIEIVKCHKFVYFEEE